MPLRIMDYEYCNRDYDTPLLQGLILLPCTNIRGTYRRVGLLTTSEQIAWDAFKGGQWLFQSETRISDRRLYQSTWPKGEYTITIV